jgi:hypothetical protein
MANFKKLTLPANAVLFAALILSLLVTISLPLLTALDISRISPGDDTIVPEIDNLAVERRVSLDSLLVTGDASELNAREHSLAFGLRVVGITKTTSVVNLEVKWVYFDESVGLTVPVQGVGYAVALAYAEPGSGEPTGKIVWITGAWTRGLGIHPVGKSFPTSRELISLTAAIVTGAEVLALGASLTTMHTINLLAPLVCLLAAAITLFAFVIDIALHVHIIVTLKKLTVPAGYIRPNVSAGPGTSRPFC